MQKWSLAESCQKETDYWYWRDSAEKCQEKNILKDQKLFT